jgi:hypothetical protein
MLVGSEYFFDPVDNVEVVDKPLDKGAQDDGRPQPRPHRPALGTLGLSAHPSSSLRR